MGVTPVTCPHATERFRNAVLHHLGLQFDEARLGFLAETLQRRVAELRTSVNVYLRDLEIGPSANERGALARELTVGETYFFRNSEQFRALGELVLPERMQAAPRKTLRILSAGCASGEEPYSVAILLRETVFDPAWDITVRAVDINPAALDKAARARYSAWALRETPADVQRKWFRAAGRDQLLDESIRTGVLFEERNLAADDPVLWQPQSFDVIFCRNMIMYFAAEAARALLARIARSLRPGGYLFLGHAETLRGLSDEFHLRHTHGTFYYQRKEPTDAVGDRRVPPFLGFAAAGDAIPISDDAWVGVIRAASDRVATLVSAPETPKRPDSSAPPGWNLAAAFELLRTERFAEALALVRRLPAGSARDPDVLLLTATLLAHSNQPAAAEDACRKLLLIDDLNAGGHYVFALCREAVGDAAGAVEHDRVATYLDPAFAMPRLHLGLLARRAGDRGAARRDLAQALILLRREDASRLLLFGGGFSRDGLLAVCDAALRDCGGEL